MKGAKITLANGKKFALVPRSGSYSIIWQALPENLRNPIGERWHPINATTDNIGSPLNQEDVFDLCCLVRDPIERFRSACARQKVSVEQGLAIKNYDVHFWSLEDMGLIQSGVTYFKFPEQINDCANWLGLSVPVPILNAEHVKPELSDGDLLYISKEYEKDIFLFKSLKEILL